MLSFIGFIILGAIAGWLAGLLFKGTGFGLLGDIVIGIIGGVIGGWIAEDLLHITLGGVIGDLIVAVAGALVLLWVISLLKRAT
ncbi:MAG TPA: GlsB/YeaQ/YmgE family stress response membrane protein [Mucilaginibacter sp.]|jgi:uncharacterized membrane protein YeaQ/YmgE (transglycosylase-associated protein family)